ncbi:MAG: hypothetical protein AB2813_00170 [Candidatus Sedimenticola endophacoides]
MMEGALQQASKTRGMELIQLLQFSVVKFLLQQVRTQFRAFREQVKSAGSPHQGEIALNRKPTQKHKDTI